MRPFMTSLNCPVLGRKLVRCIKALFLILGLFLAVLDTWAQSMPAAQSTLNASINEQPKTPTYQPKICLVLSGGGARGFAHIGVLQYLEEHHIPIHCIAGTSMGAVIGGLYASGMKSDEILERLNGIKLGDVALDVIDRRDLPQAVRDDDKNYPISGTFGVNKKGLTLPLGAVQANQFLEILHNWTAHIPPDIDFDKLPIPFRAVATDLENGRMVVFEHGPLHTAIRASMAAPGVFAPIEIDGRLLSDGGLVRNLPVDIAQGMGADVIIAVNIGTPVMSRDKLTSFVNVSQQMLNILTEQNVNEQKKLLHPNDILIDADLGNITFMDFPRAKEAVKIGYEAAVHQQTILAQLERNVAEYQLVAAERNNPVLPPIKIAFVEVQTTGKIPPADIKRQLHIEIGAVYDAADINRRITPLINSRQYEDVTHSLIERQGQYGVLIKANERSWGPNFVRLGLEMSTGFDGQSGFELQVGHRLPWINESGLEWRNDLTFGNIYGIRSELRQPLLVREGMYLAPFVSADIKTLNVYADNTRIAEYTMQGSHLGVDLGIPLGSNADLGEIRTGFIFNHYNLRPKLGGLISTNSNGSTSVTTLPWARTDEVALHSRFVIDQLDKPVFPRAGYYLDGEILAGLNRDSSNASSASGLTTHDDWRNYQQATLSAVWAHSIADHSINLSMRTGARTQSGTLIPGIGLALGGFQKLTAYQPDQFIGDYLLYGNLTYLYRAVDFGLAGESAFIGASFEAGNAGNSKSSFYSANLRKSLSVFVGANTFMGPIHFGVAIAPAGAFNLFLQIGRQ